MLNEVKMIKIVKRNGKKVIAGGIWKWGPLFNDQHKKSDSTSKSVK